MGSSGTGRLSDYPGKTNGKKPSGKGRGGGSGGGGGGEGGKPQEDRCGKAFNVKLEDVEQCAYFRVHKGVPKVGTALGIAHKKRIIATTAGGEEVGYLPTQFNYLAACISGGFSYAGNVVTSANGPPVATVVVDFAPVAPK